MKLLLALEFRFSRARNGEIFTTSVYPRSFFERYLERFSEVIVLARVHDLDLAVPPAGAAVLGDDRVRVHALPGYVGLRQLITSYPRVRREVRAALVDVDAAVLRAPGFVSEVLGRAARRARVPYLVEVVGDPQEVFTRGASDHPARVLAQRFSVRSLRRIVGGAVAVGYVSRTVLPQRYPAAAGAVQDFYSSVDLAPSAFAATARPVSPILRLVTVASLEQPYKGVDDLLRALADCPAEMTLVVVGDGRCRRDLEELATQLNLGPRVRFAGQLPGTAAVGEVFGTSDAFVLASRTEGLPRAMIEAMAAGLPCVGTDVGGIPELLPEEARCPAGRPELLAGLIRGLHEDPDHAAALAAVLHRRAQRYAAAELGRARDQVYRALADAASSGSPRAGRRR